MTSEQIRYDHGPTDAAFREERERGEDEIHHNYPREHLQISTTFFIFNNISHPL